MSIAIYSLTSELHDEKSVSAVTSDFLGRIGIDYAWRGEDYTDYGKHTLSLIYVRTGGTEGIFKRLLPRLQEQSSNPIYLLSSDKSNSLAASMEILSFLRQQGLNGEIIHGSADYINRRIIMLEKVNRARLKLKQCRLGIIGAPSDWLISSHYDPTMVNRRLGIELIDITMKELLDTLSQLPAAACEEKTDNAAVAEAIPGADRIYRALQSIVVKYGLTGFTLRCFDLLTSVRNTGCLALAKLNAQGIAAGCEGDVPALLTMAISQALFGVSGFQANPARIDPECGEILFAHCTIPLNMVQRYEFDTHYESGIGVGIRGYAPAGPVTICKVSGDLSRVFAEEGELITSQAEPDLCRTQQIIRLTDASKVSYFLTHSIGNHHIIVPGHHKMMIEELLK